jgi:hypothetical protein
MLHPLYENENLNIIVERVTFDLYHMHAVAGGAKCANDHRQCLCIVSSPKRSDLSDPSGSLSASVSPAAIKEANDAARSVTSEGKSKRRGSYAKFTPEQQAAIEKYFALHGNQAAVRHFSKQLEVNVKVTSIQTRKTKYLAEINRKRKEDETDNLTVKSLPVKTHGRSLLLGEKLDSEVKSYIKAVREEDGVITTSVIMAAATAIVRKGDRSLLAEMEAISRSPQGRL